MRTAPVSSGGMAIVVTSRREHMAVFIAHGLRPLPRTSRYELWLMGPRGERPAGMLGSDRKDMAGPALITGMSAGDMVGLTVEPASGSLRPTSAPARADRAGGSASGASLGLALANGARRWARACRPG